MSQTHLLTNHALALVCLARQPGLRLREVADCVGVTERAAHRIVCELQGAGYLTRHRVGRRNFYEIHVEAPLSDPLGDGRTVGDLLSPFVGREHGRPQSVA